MYAVHAKNGRVVARFAKQHAAEAFVRAQRSPGGDDLHERIARALGWSVRDTQSMSLQSLCDLVRPVDPALAQEISHVVSGGHHVGRRSRSPGNKEALLNRARRNRATYQRRASSASETFRAVATSHRGDTLGAWTGPSVQGLIATVDHALPLTKAWSVTIRGEYTSDGTWHANHGGRVVASREAGPDRGRGGWITY